MDDSLLVKKIDNISDTEAIITNTTIHNIVELEILLIKSFNPSKLCESIKTENTEPIVIKHILLINCV